MNGNWKIDWYNGIDMTELKIKWQRLVDDHGQTCDRCTGTGYAIHTAAEMLREALAPLGIAVITEIIKLSTSEFMHAPLESNRVWIGNRPIEEWLVAEVGQSQCCGSCGEHECRTVSVSEQRYEVIPKELVLKAGLLAAAELVAPPGSCIFIDE